MKTKMTTIALAMGVFSLQAHAQHSTDLWPGQSGGRVALSPGGLKPSSVYHPLVRVDTFLHGWSANNPGFDRATVTVGVVSPLPATAQIWLKVVSLDPALFVIDNAFNVLENPGDMTFLGTGTDLHVHLTWFIDETDPGFDPDQCTWEGTFTLIDTRTGLGPSEPFTLPFANVPVRGGEFPPQDIPADGDFNGDGDTDPVDIEWFTACMGGPAGGLPPDDPGVGVCEVDCFNAFGFDDDVDVDLRDFAALQRWLSP